MNQRYWKILVFLISLLFLSIPEFLAQEVTKVSGSVLDKNTKEPLAFVNVSFLGTAVGTSTDLDGKFNLETRFPSDTLLIEYLGYNPLKVYVEAAAKVKETFYLESESHQLDIVNITATKKKYQKKNNPSIELMKKVRANRDRNRLDGEAYYNYDQYEKVRLDINNITEEFKQGRFIRDFDFLWEFIDTSDVNGRTFLPVFMREILSTKYYRKDIDTHRELRKAVNYTKVNDRVDANSLNSVIDILYTDVDIYKDQIQLLENNFVSPISDDGVNFYRYYIQDTTYIHGKSAINLAFIPEDKGDLGFYGNMYISNDDRYTILKVKLGIVNGINLNFVRDISVEQEFKEKNGRYLPVKDELVIDYAITENGIGFFGTRSVDYDNFDFDVPENLDIFEGVETIVQANGIFDRDTSYWSDNRISPLNQTEVNLYNMMDTLRNNRRYQTYVVGLEILTTGYVPVGPLEIGKISNFANFNQVEGWTYRFGLGTKRRFSPKLRLTGNIAYAQRTKNWKWFGQAVYSFNKDWLKTPKHQIRFAAEEASVFPGQELEQFSPENILLSFRRGIATRMLLTTRYDLNYLHEMSGFSYELAGSVRRRKPLGTIDFVSQELDTGIPVVTENINSTELSLKLRYAPNEQFIQGKDKRLQLQNEFPIISLKYTRGINNLLGGDYDYHRLNATLFKQKEWTEIGTTNLNFEGGYSWGDIPYILQYIPRGNQTYAYQLTSYNLMNFLEFAADKYISFQGEHYFYGYFLNNVPLIRKLKLREVLTFKAYYGDLADRNNPNLNPEQIQFTRDENGNANTFTFGDLPYMEASIGFTNILKIVRIDLVQRLTYLDNPDVPQLFGNKGLAIRFRTWVEF